MWLYSHALCKRDLQFSPKGLYVRNVQYKCSFIDPPHWAPCTLSLDFSTGMNNEGSNFFWPEKLKTNFFFTSCVAELTFFLLVLLIFCWVLIQRFNLYLLSPSFLVSRMGRTVVSQHEMSCFSLSYHKLSI